MSTEHDSTSAAESTTEPGPSLLTERPLLGIFVHLLGLLTSIVGPGVLYLVSSREFTRQNARNAFNWQLLLALSWTGVLVAMVGWILLAELPLVPDLLAIAMFLVIFLAMFGLIVLSFCNLLFPLVATGKAIFGSAWSYPLVPDFLAYLE
ncbi:DUF4870 domain-containing protein [Salinadaptatus halalkaliphilus]|uniref:DUF4870 domain-containing protein n=1 Tax=Salinadaptatus halalkaliphilus TaxID=2419781 RepID=A0A4S3TLY4_9EURY|nr:DUF4870 domain-containing protein [Salinadaptatus halalkaliphilus]THE63638.1 DUF4870 domain-containing protein [Salinadaptatus halalkaliphilus]